MPLQTAERRKSRAANSNAVGVVTTCGKCGWMVLPRRARPIETWQSSLKQLVPRLLPPSLLSSGILFRPFPLFLSQIEFLPLRQTGRPPLYTTLHHSPALTARSSYLRSIGMQASSIFVTEVWHKFHSTKPPDQLDSSVPPFLICLIVQDDVGNTNLMTFIGTAASR